MYFEFNSTLNVATDKLSGSSGVIVKRATWHLVEGIPSKEKKRRMTYLIANKSLETSMIPSYLNDHYGTKRKAIVTYEIIHL